ncbi:hypothetical protein Q5P01_004055 [Channa striata]|uniref:Uncharacterized protein n=1 Tax=Channa striata TaxID=64152 RepID=A0AA88NMY4_CHASR|nr:hypothetical protein Q5P01_004055 [Channa striata]
MGCLRTLARGHSRKYQIQGEVDDAQRFPSITELQQWPEGLSGLKPSSADSSSSSSISLPLPRHSSLPRPYGSSSVMESLLL